MKRITEYTNIETIAESDVLPIVDVSDTSQASTGSTKKGSIEKIADYLKARVETLTNKTINVSDNTLSGMLDWFYPVGTIYETTSTDLDTTTKMATHFGGTWEAYGSGKVLVAKSADTEFDTIGKMGGDKTHTLTVAEMPSHSHNLKGNSNLPLVNGAYSGDSGWDVCQELGLSNGGMLVETMLSNTGGDQPHNNLQPYIVVYRYRRTS